MNKKILVAYATRTGSTIDVAKTIGETLGARGFSVDVKPINENPSTGGYQSVIIGSAVNGAAWLPEAVDYVKSHQQALNGTPVAYFCVHALNLGDDEGSKKNRMAYMNNARTLLKPVAEAFFAGVGPYPEKTNPIVMWVYRTFKIGGEGDCRDWTKIRAWAESVFA